MNQHKIIFSVLLFFMLAVSVTSCREEVISPKNDSSNVNEPFKSNIGNSFTFIINGKNISQKVIDYPLFSYTNSSIFISVLDHNSGSVEVILFNKTQQIIYRNKISDEQRGSYDRLQGTIPQKIEINLNEFTGKLKIQVTGTL